MTTSRKAQTREPRTALERIAWSYAGLACAHAALRCGRVKYARTDFMVRAKLRRRLVDGTMHIDSLLDDERLKLTLPRACCYCGSRKKLCAEHLIPRLREGPDAADNIVWACRSCNSSKGARELLAWMAKKERFPALLVLRRYIKIVHRYCTDAGILQREIAALQEEEDLPFDLRLLPIRYPPLTELTLWIEPDDETRDDRHTKRAGGNCRTASC